MSKTLSAVAGLLLLAAASGSSAPVPAPSPSPAAPAAGLAKATFAGGCFWCMEGPFDQVPGVVSTTSGYTGGSVKRPSYEQVSTGTTGHAESVEVLYDPTKVGYAQLLEVFWHNVDPTDGGGQFCDRGNQYRAAIFFHDDEQRRLAEQSKKDLEASGKLKRPIVTQVVPAGEFYAAEDYHQDFYKKNAFRYRYYRLNCGRDARLKELWGPAAGH